MKTIKMFCYAWTAEVRLSYSDDTVADERDKYILGSRPIS